MITGNKSNIKLLNKYFCLFIIILFMGTIGDSPLKTDGCHNDYYCWSKPNLLIHRTVSEMNILASELVIM